MDTEKEMVCFFCREIITKKELEGNTVEMLTGPNNKKVFSHIHHKGVKTEAEQFDPKKE